MTMLAEIKHRHNLRKVTDLPIVRILGPDQASKDMDNLLEMLDAHKELLRDLGIFLRANQRQNDELAQDLLARIGAATE